MTKVLTFEEIQKYLDFVRCGEGLAKAARRIGVAPNLVTNARKANPEFDEMVRVAEIEAAEPVEGKLYQAALMGEPWAVKLWLERRSKERWGALPTTVKVEHELGPGVERLAELAQRLEQRRQMLGLNAADVVDVEAEPE